MTEDWKHLSPQRFKHFLRISNFFKTNDAMYEGRNKNSMDRQNHLSEKHSEREMDAATLTTKPPARRTSCAFSGRLHTG